MRVKLDDVCEFINGGAWSQDEYVGLGIPVLKVSNLQKDNVDLTDVDYLSAESLDKYAKNQLLEHDLVIATVGSHPGMINSAAGRAVIIPRAVEGYLLNQNAVCIRAFKLDLLDQRYLGFLGKTHAFQHYIQQRGKGAANQMRIAIEEIRAYETTLPPLPIQRRIAEVLGRYDALIENYQQQIGLLEALAQNLYREWFVRGRCPYAQTQAGGLPVGWRKITIGEVCTIGRGSSPRPINDDVYFVDGTIPWIKIADATASGKFLYETKEHVNEYGASFSRYLNEGSLIIATSGTLGFCTLLGVKGCVHDGWLYISEYREGVSPSFMYFVINSLTEYLNNLSYGAAIQNINSDILRETPMILPTKDILGRFLKIIAPIDLKIDNLSRQLNQLRQMRDKLLPRLMSGQLAVGSSGAECL